MDNKLAYKTSIISIAINLVLSIIKLLAGIIANSSAMVSDSIHSASDIFSTIIVIIGINISSKESDKEHPYGHERFECVASIILAVTLLITGLLIGYEGLQVIVSGDYRTLEIPGKIALIAAIISILTKEAMYWYTRYIAKKIESIALMADAWHHRSDAISSIGALIGIFGARLGFVILDSLASILICLLIVKTAYDIFNEAMNKMIDKACDDKMVQKITDSINGVSGVKHIDEMRTRLFGNKIYIDLEIAVEGSLSLIEAHNIAEDVHKTIENKFTSVKHCMVHVNPCG